MTDSMVSKCIMEVWVFSYNRGTFLKNCIDSIETCLPEGIAISVFDDCSDDIHTQKILNEIREKHRVVQPSKVELQSKHGGLYGNLQALVSSESITPRADLICCIQDDTQVVRMVQANEILKIRTLFSQHGKLGFVQPAFLRGCNEKRDASRTRYEATMNGYYVDRYNKSAGAFYSDIFISSISRLKSVNWSFAPREAANERAARETFEQMIYLRNPFVAWLPNVPAFRGKKQTFAMKIAQRQQKSDLYPIHIMGHEESKRFVMRQSEQLPYAEHFLDVINGPVKTPWRYYPLQGRRWLKRLNQMELALNNVTVKFI